MSSSAWLRGAVFGLVLLAHAAAARAELTIAAASDLQMLLPQLAERFERQTGQTVRVVYGSSGNFVSQIQNGAPFDLFLSADTEYVQRLVSAGQGVGASVVEYASGRLVLWARADRRLDLARGLAVVSNAGVRRIAVANPQHAPYGRAAVAALEKAGLYDQVRSRLVLGENIAQAAQFVESGNADVGLIALSIAVSPALRSTGAYQEIPSDLYPPIRQSGVVLTRSSQAAAARQFLIFLTSPAVTALFEASGFGPPR